MQTADLPTLVGSYADSYAGSYVRSNAGSFGGSTATGLSAVPTTDGNILVRSDGLAAVTVCSTRLSASADCQLLPVPRLAQLLELLQTVNATPTRGVRRMHA